MRGALLAFAPVLGVAGCVTVTATPVKAPDGQPAIVIECHRNEAECVTKAQSECPRGYWVLDADARARGEFAGSGVRTQGFAGHIMIRCQ